MPTDTATAQATRYTTIDLRVIPQSAHIARQFVASVIRDHTYDPDTIAIAVSELVTNAIRACAALANDTRHPWQPQDTPVRFGIHCTNRHCHLTCRDPHPDDPKLCYADADAESGRGVLLLEALAADLWTTHEQLAKVVHAVILAPGVNDLTREEWRVLRGP